MMTYQNTHNPVLPPEIHIPDSEAHVFSDGKLYLYGSFDGLENDYCSDKYYVVSTADMEHWEITPDAFSLKDIPWALEENPTIYPGEIDWMNPTPFLAKMLQNMIEEITAAGINPEEYVAPEKKLLLFAPDCIEKNGKYYLYFCLNDDREGVAVADSPEGPFENAIQFPCGGIDPAIFVDDDGKAYYYWGQINLHGVCLNKDMVSFSPIDVKNKLITEEEHFFHEGSSMRKIGDTYYLVFTDVERGKATSLGYATSKSPLGPFTYRGIIIDNDGCDPSSWNNHGSIEEVNGQWYVFYHRSSRGTKMYRRLCIEPIQILEDGTIPEVKMTSQGVGDPFQVGETIFGYQACGLKGKLYIGPGVSDRNCQKLEPAEDGKEGSFVDASQENSECLAYISDGDEAIFRYVNLDESCKGIQMEATGSGKVEVYLEKCLEEEKILLTTLEIVEGEVEKVDFGRELDGRYEVTLKFVETDQLKVYRFTFT